MAAVYVEAAGQEDHPGRRGGADIGGPDAIWRDPSKTPDHAPAICCPASPSEKISLLHANGTFTSPGLPRFDIPKLWMSDGPQGVREENQPDRLGSANHTDDFSTAMPADIGLAASFDTDLAKAYGNVIGEEARTRGKNIMLCPGPQHHAHPAQRPQFRVSSAKTPTSPAGWPSGSSPPCSRTACRRRPNTTP